MKRNPYYRLEYIEGVPYLLAFGQANADFKHDVRLNETSAFLWCNLENAASNKELVSLCAAHFQCSPQQYEALETTTAEFINMLQQSGILLPEENRIGGISLYKSLEIAGLFCRLYGPAEAFAKELDAFTATSEFPDDAPIQDVCIRTTAPPYTENGILLLRNRDLFVIEGRDKFILSFPSSPYISEIHMSKSGRTVSIFCAPVFTKEAVNDISYAMRITFLYFAQLHNMLAIHSASILYRDKIWLFSAPSGTGKSTHAQLWKETYQTPIINGDLNLITLQNDTPVVHGIPWCGTSEIFDTHTYPLGGIIFLNQGSQNKVGNPSPERRQLLLLHRSISPSWEEAMQQRNLNVVRSISPDIFLCHYFCTKEKDAAECLKEAIDEYLDKK